MGALALALVHYLKDMRVRVGLALLLVVILVSLVYTQSRASYLAVIPVCLTFSILSRRRFYLIAGLIIALALSPFIIPRVARERILFTFKQPEEKGQIQFGKLRLDTSLSARVIGFKKALSAWRKSPFLGYGVSGFMFMDAQYPRILVETGIIGMARSLCGAYCWTGRFASACHWRQYVHYRSHNGAILVSYWYYRRSVCNG
jgi:O-antigen ligase